MGVEHLGISKVKGGGGGFKMSMPPVVGHGYFLESLIPYTTSSLISALTCCRYLSVVFHM